MNMSMDIKLAHWVSSWVKCSLSLVLFGASCYLSGIDTGVLLSVLILLVGYTAVVVFDYHRSVSLHRHSNQLASIKKRMISRCLDNLAICVSAFALLVAGLKQGTSLLQAEPEIVYVLVVGSLLLTAMMFQTRKGGSAKAVVVRESVERNPNFQVTVQDTDKLLTIQAARILCYAATNYHEDKGFYASVDLNRFNARLFHTAGYLEDANFLRWRAAVLLAGPAAEFVINNRSTVGVIDDLEECEEVIRHILALHTGKSTFLRPSNATEALLNQRELNKVKNKFLMAMRNFVLHNRTPLLEVKALLKKKSVIYASDLTDILSRVNARNLPKATFDQLPEQDELLGDYEDSLIAADISFSEATGMDIQPNRSPISHV